MSPKRVLLFDVNETLLDMAALDSHFVRLFGDARVRREWFTTMLGSASTSFFAKWAFVASIVPGSM